MKSMITKNAGISTTISIPMPPGQYSVMRIAWWSASMASSLDAAIGRVPMPYCPGGRHGWRFWMKPQNTNKTQLLPRFVTVGRSKKAKQIRDPKWTLYSCHQFNKLRTNTRPYYSSWRAQLNFELSSVVNGQKIKKNINLERSPRKPVGQIWPYQLSRYRSTYRR